MKTAIYTSPVFLKHDTGHNHPECSARMKGLFDLFDTDLKHVEQKEFYPAAPEDIALAHHDHYIDDLMDKIPDTGTAAVDVAGECILSPASWDALMMAAGAGLTALNDIIDGDITRAFCAIRPPGHHAEASKAMGFCFFNNAFIAARAAQERHGLPRIAIVDFDVHHGNGTDALTRAHNMANPDKPILYISSHQHPLWPMTGLPSDNTDHIINISLPEGTNGAQMMKAYEDLAFPALHLYEPDLMILSAGFDAHRDDPLAGLALHEEDFATLTTALADIANIHAKGRILSLLEGGYNIIALKSSVHAHINALLK
ncbi:MAG: histone deacetylase family protein [Alphaproteobacteria bacterium]|nr:histone deacetylase family protein [Alphaproteobacteria bacterium]NCQ88278.1 histone deacetylase family protein [Alphaproteobacteria bacterium]NCT05215.1 histone deacetylase family protein [Alphaproteobacteria bacterium]